MNANPEAFRLLLSLPRPASAEHVRLAFSRSFDRKEHANDEANIGAAWAAAKAKNPGIFDGSKFRLHRAAEAGTDGSVLLELGLTGYREYLGTNRLPAAERGQLEADGRAAHGDAAAHMSNALGCETMLLTADGQVVLLRRSTSVATHNGLYNGPSGHPEPSRAAGVDDAADAAADANEVDAARSAATLAELFDSVLQETHEETAVPRDKLGAPVLLGVMLDAAGKPDLLFLTRTPLDAAGVRECYSTGPEEGWESDRLAFWPVATLPECTLGLTAVTRAAHECFLRLQPG